MAHIDKHENVYKAIARAQIVFDKSAPLLLFLLVYFRISIPRKVNEIIFAVVYLEIIEQTSSAGFLRCLGKFVLVHHKIDKRGLADVGLARNRNFGYAVIGHLARVCHTRYEFCLFYHLLHLLFYDVLMSFQTQKL